MSFTAQQVAAHNARVAAGQRKNFRGGGFQILQASPAAHTGFPAALIKPQDHDLHPLDTTSSPVTEPAVCNEPVAAQAREASHSTRFRIRVESRRRRLIDPDNLCPKYLIDCLRYAEVIPDDSARYVEVQTTQTRVQTKAEEGTQVTITETP